MENYPVPFSDNKIVVMILAFNFKHIYGIHMIFSEYASICEAWWDVSLVFFTCVDWSADIHRFAQSKGYCYRTGKSI